MTRSLDRPGAVRIGISGWTYPPWRGVFYPRGLPQKQELAYAAAPAFCLNGTTPGLILRTPGDGVITAAGAGNGQKIEKLQITSIGLSAYRKRNMVYIVLSPGKRQGLIPLPRSGVRRAKLVDEI